MKKFHFSGYFAIALSSILLVTALHSCKKQLVEDQNLTNKTQSSQNQMPTMFVAGFDFDLVGKAHNNYVDYVRSNPNYPNMSAKEVYDYGTGYNDPIFGSQTHPPYSQALEDLNYTIGLSDNLIVNQVDPTSQLLQDSLINQTMVPYLNELASIYIDAADTISHVPYSPQQFTQMIGVLEQNIVNNLTIEYDANTQIGNEGAILLSMCSIAKYSYEYWYNDATSNNTASPMAFGFLKKIWNGIKVGAADAWGGARELTISVGLTGPTVSGKVGEVVDAAGEASCEQDCRNRS